MTASWTFNLDPDESVEGWVDSSAGTFQGAPISSLARELIQNSLDAKNKDSSAVKIKFKAHRVKRDNLPDVASLQKTIGQCVESQAFHGGHKFLIKRAEEVINQNDMLILSITEEGTLGMNGPCEPGKDIFNYMKAKGLSSKPRSEGKRGSHGVGKVAPILCSEINTILASTRYVDDDKSEKTLILGRASLSSHYDSDEKIRKAVGYWGEESQPVPYNSSLPEWLCRKTIGTDIHIIGFKEPDCWATTLIASVIRNFFIIICEGKLEVEIEVDRDHAASNDLIELDEDIEEETGDQLIYTINKNNIAKYFDSKKIRWDLNFGTDLPLKSLQQAKGLYAAYIAQDNKHDQKVEGFGLVRFHLRTISDEEPAYYEFGSRPEKYNIGIVRDGMYITEKIPNLISKQAFQNSCYPFDFLIETISEKGSDLIRSMEPPAHDEIKTSNIPDPVQERMARKYLQDLASTAKTYIQYKAGIASNESNDAEIFDDWFTVEGDDGGASEEYDPTAGYDLIRKHQCSPKKKESKDDDDDCVFDDELDGDDGEQGGKGEGKGGDYGVDSGDGPGYGKGRGGTGIKGGLVHDPKKPKRQRPLKLQNTRMIRLSDKKMTLFFSCGQTATIYLSISEIGADTQRALPIIKSSRGVVLDKGLIEIEIKENERCSLEIETKISSSKAIELYAEKVAS